MYYRRLTDSLNDSGVLIPEDENFFEYITDFDRDWYLSTFKYNESQWQHFKTEGTIAGITDVVTDKLWWDFDSEFEPTAALDDANTLLERLIVEHGIDEFQVSLTFSGNKGFGVEVNIDELLTPKQVKNIAFALAKDLKTFDVKMYNASRILRVLGTRHQKTGLYKIPIDLGSLPLHVDDVMVLAKKEPQEIHLTDRITLPKSVLDLKGETLVEKEKKESPDRILTNALDFSKKPKFLSNCRWGLQNGFFQEGERSHALLCLAATYKNLGFEQEHVYRLLKGVAELQSTRNNVDRFADAELWNNIVMQVFGPFWQGGQYTCREENNWLQTYCHSLGDNKCDHKTEEDLRPKHIVELNPSFKEYVMHIDENTIHTGLPSIDKHVFLSTGCNLGIIGSAGSGKTSIGLEILNNTSKAGVISVCAGLDMAKNRFFEKVLYRVSGYSREELYKVYQNNEEGELLEKMKEEFGNVYFFKKSCPTVEDIKEYVINVQEQTGKKVKLVVTDYFERIVTDIGDDTAASKRIAGELQDLVDDLDICNITLVQPNKAALSGGPDQPIYDYTKIKGSSFVYQAFRIIMSCWRPFYNPKDFTNDKWMQMAVLKNDLGELAEMGFSWNGKRGMIGELEDFQVEELRLMLKAKENAKEQKDDGFNF